MENALTFFLFSLSLLLSLTHTYSALTCHSLSSAMTNGSSLRLGTKAVMLQLRLEIRFNIGFLLLPSHEPSLHTQTRARSPRADKMHMAVCYEFRRRLNSCSSALSSTMNARTHWHHNYLHIFLNHLRLQRSYIVVILMASHETNLSTLSAYYLIYMHIVHIIDWCDEKALV